MVPVFVKLGAIALGGYYLLKGKRASAQGVSGINTAGIPVTVISPVPDSVNYAQSSGTSTSPPAKTSKPVPQTTPSGTVMAPPKTVQSNGRGGVQPPLVVITPTGSASTAIGTVKAVQAALNALGYLPKLKEDGKLGPATIANIKAFQKKTAMVVTGDAGAAVQAALSAAVAAMAVMTAPETKPATGAFSPPATSGSKLLSNLDIQKKLNQLGAKPALQVDGKMGPKSVAAVKAFQATHGLVADGVPGAKTQAALIAATTGMHGEYTRATKQFG